MKIIRIAVQSAIIIPAAIMLLWSCCTKVTTGTLIGLLLFGGIIAAALLYRQIWGIIRRLWKRAVGKAVVICAAAVLTSALALVGFFNVQMFSHISRPAENLQCIIVLGCRVKGETPSSMLWVRTRAAYEALCEHPEAVCIVSGGQGEGEDISEAEAMRRLLREWGIAEERIIMEDKSTSTKENLDNSAAILQELGITESIAIATSEYHQYRASIYAKRSGLGEVGSYSAGTRRYMLLNCWLREWAALAAELILGY